MVKTLPLLMMLLALTATLGKADPKVDNSSLAGKFIVGYQGWFSCPGDRGPASGWGHWFDGAIPTVEMLPDVSEFTDHETCATGLTTESGKSIRVFSSNVPSVVTRHFQWMRQYGIDGAAIGRFAIDLKAAGSRDQLDGVLSAARHGAEAAGRIFFVTYDLSGMLPEDAHLVIDDWRELEAAGLTTSPAYAHDRGHPVLGLWGFGFRDRKLSPLIAREMMQALHRESERYDGLALLGGVPSGWRDNEGDASPDPAWAAVYRSFEILSPWSVGRFADDSSADRFLNHNIRPDLQEALRFGIRYIPVIFPGFSWSNLTHAHGSGTSSPMNAIARRCGKFLWHQVSNIASLGVNVAFGAMFDEVDEGTALFKTLASQSESAAGDGFLTLDADGCHLPSDWYLKLSGEIARVLHGERPASPAFPLRMPN